MVRSLSFSEVVFTLGFKQVRKLGVKSIIVFLNEFFQQHKQNEQFLSGKRAVSNALKQKN